MAGRSRLCSGPEEILSHIVEHLRTPDHLMHPSWLWPDGQTIRFANDQVLDLSQVNHLFRRLCLPLLYEHIFIRLTDANSTANESTHVLPFDLFRRIMERKPHLADLVRGIEVSGGYSGGSLTNHHVFDSLPFLPKIKRIHLPFNVKLNLDSLSVINSHPSLITVHWQTTINDFSFPKPLSLPHGALSRVLIDREVLSEDYNSIELLWLYFTKLGLSVKNLIITRTTPPLFLSLTYPDLYLIYIHVAPIFSSDGPEPLGWFPSFLKRHPQLFWISFDSYEEEHMAWEALKNVPIIRPLYDASHSRGLISSFSIKSIQIERSSYNSAVINVNSPRDLPEIIHLLGSLLPIPKVSLRLEPQILPINVNDFVSAFQDNHKTLSFLTLRTVCQVLDLDSLSTDEDLHLDDTVTNEDVQSNSSLRDYTKRLAQLTRLLCAVLPQLQGVSFHEDIPGLIDYDPYVVWEFSVSGDGQVKLLQPY